MSVAKTDAPAVGTTKGMCSPATVAGSGMRPRIAGGVALTTGAGGSTCTGNYYRNKLLYFKSLPNEPPSGPMSHRQYSNPA